MSKRNIWMKKYTEVLKDGDWHPSPTQTFQEEMITIGKFEEITSKRASDFFETGNAKTVKLFVPVIARVNVPSTIFITLINFERSNL